MSTMLQFNDVVDAAGNLSPDEQIELIEILRRRLIEKNRHEIVQDVEESKREFTEGKCRAVTAGQCLDEIMR
ncbi:MAG: hypothetical protein JXB10_15140 [Pirellulales bacterium]|nr:hypothetical protein [Pirellulales bacterium]